MIELSEALLRAQRSSTIPAEHLLLRCVLTYGANAYTYKTPRLKQLTYTRQTWSHKAELMLDDTDKVLHGLNLEGYKAILGGGLITLGGEEWVDMPPLWVVGQQRDSQPQSVGGLECGLSLEGIFDRMGKHEATATYAADSGDTRTIKDWLKEVISLTDSGTESTEEQTTWDSYMPLHGDVRYFAGQRLTIDDRRITKLAFKLRRVGFPSGTITFRIYEVDQVDEYEDGLLLAEKAWGDASSLGTLAEWKEVTLDTPVQIDKEVRIICHFDSAGWGDASHYVDVAYNASSVKASEVLTELYTGATWTDQSTYDLAYKYSYSGTPLSVYEDYPAYGLVFDSEDSLIDSFIPADSFRIGLNETRLQLVKWLMGRTNCIAIPKSDGQIHIINPTTSGTDYDNEYSLVQGRDHHNFFNKRFRRRIVSPNYIIFKNHPSHSQSYGGFAKDASADLDEGSGSGSMKEIKTLYVRPLNGAQCTNLAEAYLSKLQMAADKGSAVLPFVHFGQEVYDYVNFVDARAGDNRAGNAGFLVMHYQPGQFNMRIGFGRAPLGVAALPGIATEAGVDERTGVTQGRGPSPWDIELQDWILQLEHVIEEYYASKEDVIATFKDLYEDGHFRNLTATLSMTIPSEAA